MTVNLIKLAVGADTVGALRSFQRARMAAQGFEGRVPIHTRHRPRRADEIVKGGSLYWVIRGVVRVRQRVLDLAAGHNEEGRLQCEIWLDSRVVLTNPTPWRPFQGWRYLAAADAPYDLPATGGGDAVSEPALPDGLAQAFDALGVRGPDS